MFGKKFHQDMRGAALVEFAIVGSVFLSSLFGIAEFGRLLWTHNALKDGVQRGARYATLRKSDTTSVQAVKRMVVYGDPNANPATARPIVNGLTPANVVVSYQNYNGIQLSAEATVAITNYKFQFSVPIFGGEIDLPGYSTSLPGESAGFVPCDISNANPSAACNIVPVN